MVLKLAGYPFSTCFQRVKLVLEELDVPYTFILVDMSKGAHKAPEFTTLQPFGQVPYIDDDGFVLFESRAICRYLALKYGGVEKGLMPSPGDSLEKTALFERAVSIEVTSFDPPVSAVSVENIVKPIRDQKTDKEAVARFTKTIEEKLAAYEVLLGKTRFLAGDNVTLADLFHLPYGALLEKQGIDFLVNPTKFPNVARWWKEIEARPAWQKIKSQ
ncbi:glutathione S-transferase [Epithele typhae]|uniref:glutathione S-transferase n=1 Tax=Epithele typhae TaxID=378194 RepID=UPI0020072061|nr:glutathione S-transferase [Epithele typhae]KAH9926278.1 glutathione S-transferase [Epithele typhae]